MTANIISITTPLQRHENIATIHKASAQLLVLTGRVFENSSFSPKNTTQYQKPHHVKDLCVAIVKAAVYS